MVTVYDSPDVDFVISVVGPSREGWFMVVTSPRSLVNSECARRTVRRMPTCILPLSVFPCLLHPEHTSERNRKQLVFDRGCSLSLLSVNTPETVSYKMGMKNHDLVPVELITSIAKLRHGGTHKILSTLLTFKLIAHDRSAYDGKCVVL